MKRYENNFVKLKYIWITDDKINKTMGNFALLINIDVSVTFDN